MNDEQLQATRELIDFARERAEEVYGDEGEDALNNIGYMMENAKIVEDYLDN